MLVPDRFEVSATALADVNAPSREWLHDHHAYLGLMLKLGRGGDWCGRFDVVHNTSLHHLPVAMAHSIDAPVLTTLHTPPLPWLESALALSPPDRGSVFAAVSRFTAASWRHVVRAEVVPNGVDLDRWCPGPGGGPAVWAGRLVAEKAPHLAIDACRRIGMPLELAGPLHDRDYFAREIEPRLGDDIVYAGHLDDRELAELMGRAAVVVVTPAWDEPFGLVAAEAMACGTPVAAFARGGLPEVIGPAGVICRSADIGALARALESAAQLDRSAVRRHAERTCGLDAMVRRYEAMYHAVHSEPKSAA